MNRIIILLLVVFLSEGAPSLLAETSETMQTHVRKEMLVSTEWLENELDNPDLILIHAAKSRDTYDTGHIPGAQFVGWEEIAVTRDGIPNEIPSEEMITRLIQKLGIDENKKIIIYDEGAGLEAARAYVLFDYAGLGDRAALLNGQLKKWLNEGRPAEQEVPDPQSSSYKPKFMPHVIIKFDELLEMIHSGEHMPGAHSPVIDARPAEQYSGKKAGEGIERAGHIPKAVNIFWMDQVKDSENPVIKSPEELVLLYRDVEALPGEEVVTYCRTGVQASHVYFIAKYLGYQPRLYDGSFYEWSARSEAPVEKR